jgi:hypothetical protein
MVTYREKCISPSSECIRRKDCFAACVFVEGNEAVHSSYLIGDEVHWMVPKGKLSAIIINTTNSITTAQTGDSSIR